jgi:type II secretory pathway pseudopilin PulG
MKILATSNRLRTKGNLVLGALDASAFTIIEIALCLGIIAFALVAIIGVLPTGMNVQKDNREETIINQDATVLMDAIRNGALGYDDLANYVIGITNYWAIYTMSSNGTVTPTGTSGVNGYVPDPGSGFPLTNGFRIVGLLSMPKYFGLPGFGPPPLPGVAGDFQSNYIVAYFRAMSGSAVEKPPQNSSVIQEAAFSYRLIAENAWYVPAEVPPAAGIPQLDVLRANTHDLRLLFRWPVLPTGPGNGRQTFRLLAGGQLTMTNDSGQPLFFIKPTTYVRQ